MSKEKYKHPILGELTEREVYMVKWDRKIQMEWDAEDNRKKSKLDEIIRDLHNILENDYIESFTDTGSHIAEVIEKLKSSKKEEEL